MKRLVFGSLIAIAFFLVFFASLTSQPVGALSDFTIKFIDVGQGDAAWLQTPDGLDILIDGGRYKQALEYLQDSGSPDIEVMVASHPDADHIGGLVRILEALPVYQIVRDGQDNDTQIYRDFVNLIGLQGIPDQLARWPESYTWGCCITAQVLNPVEPFAFSDLNENSVVLKVTYGIIDFLFTGDAGIPAENNILAREADLPAEILKVSHHGSPSGSGAQFLAAVQPEVAVISVGPNPYGHPSPDVISRLRSVGATVYRTDELGTITITSDGLSYAIFPSQTLTKTTQLPLILRNYGLLIHTPTPAATITSTPTSTTTPASPTAGVPSTTPTSTFIPTLTPTRTALPLPTATPTPTTTSTATLGNVQVNGSCSQFDAPGNDNENLNAEWVCLTNYGEGATDMTGWRVEDEASHGYTFAAFTLPGGATVKLHTGSGTDTQTDLYWGSASAIWNNAGDTVYLYNASGNLIDEYNY